MTGNKAPVGHFLRQIYPTAGMWRALCECGDEFRAPTEQAAEDRWYAHLDDIRHTEQEDGWTG